MRALIAIMLFISVPLMAVTVQQDKPVTLDMSAMDINRVMCVDGMVQDVFYSQEKVNQVTVSEDKIFIKLPIKKEGETLTYAKNIIDFDIICDGKAYKFFAIPSESLRGQIIYLGDPRISLALKNLRQLNGMDKEDQYVLLIDAVLSHGLLNNHIFDSLLPEKITQTLSLNSRLLQLNASYRFNGAGLRIKHYLYPGKKGEKYREEQFLIPAISQQARALTVYPLTAITDGFINIIVIEGVNQ